MTKKTNTELARVRAASKALRAGATEAKADVLPALSGILADAQEIVARELQLMKQAQTGGLPMELRDAKKLQALMSSIAATQSIQKGMAPDTEGLSDAELEAELAKLGKGPP